MTVSHCLLSITKQLHYFYANQAKKKCKIYIKYLVFYKISTLFLKILEILTNKAYYHNNLNKNIIMIVMLYYVYKKYLKVSFVPICFQHLSLTNLAFLPCLYYITTQVKVGWSHIIFINIWTYKQQVNQRLIIMLFQY